MLIRVCTAYKRESGIGRKNPQIRRLWGIVQFLLKLFIAWKVSHWREKIQAFDEPEGIAHVTNVTDVYSAGTTGVQAAGNRSGNALTYKFTKEVTLERSQLYVSKMQSLRSLQFP